MQKITSIIFSLLLTSGLLYAQENNPEAVNTQGSIGITYASFGVNNMIRLGGPVDCGGSYSGDYFRTLGITYIRPLNNWLSAEVGIEHTQHGVISEFTSPPPDFERRSRKSTARITSIPLTVRLHFLESFFFNAGAIVGIDHTKLNSIGSQSGIGALLGLAYQYSFGAGISAFVNPYTKMHALIPFQRQANQVRIWENGFRLGITYKLGKAL